MRRILVGFASAALIAAIALPSGFALAQDTSASPAAPAPTPTPELTQPPSQNLGSQCQSGGTSSASMAPAPTGGVIDWANGISGPVTISGWQSTGAEGDALTQTLCAAQAALPNLQITYQPIAGDYQAVMAANIAARTVPDLMYVNADYAQEWINQTFLEQLDPYVQKSGFDVSHFPGRGIDLQGERWHLVWLPQGHQHDRHGLQHGHGPRPAQDARRPRQVGHRQ
jgi:ABC-type glycerol-3-phosphate transport system substrate-binding protein